jgi:TolB-like protein/Tfp pilus assembly protein PilF
MSPEQARGEAVDARTDLWALGVLLYEMLTGERPFRGERETAVLHAVLHDEPKDLREHRSDASSVLEAIVERCLQKDREERYGSVETLLDDLRAAGANEVPASGAPSSAPTAGHVWSEVLPEAFRWGRFSPGRVSRRRLVGGGAVLAVLLFILNWALWPAEPASNNGSATDRALATAETPPPSIAVLPFETIGAGKPSAFTEGIHGDILTRLANVSGLKVISRTSVQQYGETLKPTPEIGEELGAAWVVEGEVQEAGGTVQVNARLIDARTDQQAWAREYQRALTAENLFAIQGEITRDIARSLRAELTAGERERIAGAPTEDLQAYRLYVQGRQRLAHVAFSRPEILTEAVPYFRRAVERDSSFALAWVGLADAAAYVDYYKTYLGWPDTLRTPRVNKEEAARIALELDPNLAEAHASMGLIQLVDGDAPAAARQLRKAIDLKPSYWEAHQWLGYLYLIIGRAQGAVGHLELALELNPEHAFARHWLYDAYLAAGEAKKSLEEARRQQRLGLEGVAAIAGEVRALYRLERFEEARRTAQEQVADRGPETTWGAWFRAYLVGIHAAEGDTASARKYLDQLRDADLPTLGMLAWAYAGLDVGQALAIYQRLGETDWRRIGPSHQFRYGTGTDMERLRADPRYEELLQAANRSWGLTPDGSIPTADDVSLPSDPEADV